MDPAAHIGKSVALPKTSQLTLLSALLPVKMSGKPDSHFPAAHIASSKRESLSLSENVIPSAMRVSGTVIWRHLMCTLYL